nr:zinc ribbon domain-containing protein [Sporomusa silvacetica]
MECPNCGTVTRFDFTHCPRCGHQLLIEQEQPFPNWRRLPGFRTKTLWKMVIAGIIYIVLLIAIIVPLFLSL